MKSLLFGMPILLLCICCKPSTTNKEDIDNARKADSLRTVTDSVATARNMRSMQSGMHLHNNADLAAAAHQDPQKTNRIKKVQRERRESRIENEKKRSEAMKEAIERRKAEKGL